MLEIIQARDFKKYSSLIEGLKLSDEIISIVEAIDKGQAIGCGIYHYGEKMVIIDYIDSHDDKYLYDGIIRTILFLAMSNGINSAEFNIAEKTILKDLKFVNNNDYYIQSIAEFMNNCKNCKKSC